MSWLPACRSRPGSHYPLFPNSTKEDQWGMENVWSFTRGRHASNGLYVALYQYVLSILFYQLAVVQ